MKWPVILLTLLCLSVNAKTVTIKGHINGNLPDKLHYTAPVNGAMGFPLYYTTPVKDNGDFEIKCDIDDITFIYVCYNYNNAGYIMAQPGGEYNLEITEANGQVFNTVTGSDAQAQNVYHRALDQNITAMIHKLALDAVRIESATELQEYFDNIEDAAKHDFLFAVEEKQLSQTQYNALLKNYHLYCQASLGYTVFLKHVFSESEATPSNLEPFDRLWKSIYEKQNPADPELKKSPLGGMFLDGYKNYRLYETAGFKGKQVVNNNTSLFESIMRGADLVSNQNAEFYFAWTIYQNVYAEQKEKGCLEAFSRFKEQYPTSGFIPYLENALAPVAAFYAQSNALPQGAAYIDNYSQVNTFNELVNKLPGQRLCINVWATWKAPLSHEFKYDIVLYKLLKANNITMVYVSLDEDDYDETWKKMIGYCGFTGYHMRANPTLQDDLDTLFNSDGDEDSSGILIPWYILVNSNGTIQELHAAPPSDLKELENQLKQL